MLIKNGKVLINEVMEDLDIYIVDGHIAKMGRGISVGNEEDIIDATGLDILPGFIDVHTHGGDNVDINVATSEDLNKLSRFFASHGVTCFLGSILTDTEEQTRWCIDQFNDRIDRGCDGATLLGIHLEGPFLSPTYKGAMPVQLLRSGDYDLIASYQKQARGRIKYITMAPEEDSNMDIIGRIKELGIVVSMGHSNCTYAQAKMAIEKGVSSATHLMNAMRPIHQHEIGIVGATLTSDIYAEVICDGLHLVPSTLEFIAHNKGLDRLVSVTDSIMATGLADGRYRLGINDVVVINGDARLACEDVRAGSTLVADKGFNNCKDFLNKPTAEVAKMFSKNPADMLVLSDRGRISIGNIADFTIFKGREHRMTIVKGRRVI